MKGSSRLERRIRSRALPLRCGSWRGERARPVNPKGSSAPADWPLDDIEGRPQTPSTLTQLGKLCGWKGEKPVAAKICGLSRRNAAAPISQALAEERA